MDIKVHCVINHTSTGRCYFLGDERERKEGTRKKSEKGDMMKKKEYVITKDVRLFIQMFLPATMAKRDLLLPLLSQSSAAGQDHWNKERTAIIISTIHRGQASTNQRY